MLKIYAQTDEDAKKEAIRKIDKRFEEMKVSIENNSKEAQMITLQHHKTPHCG